MLPRKTAATTLLISAVLHTSAFASDWLGGSGIFSDPAQWSPSLPGPADPANFPTGGNVVITTNPSTLSLTIPASTSLSFIDSPSNLPPLPHVYSLLGSAPNTLDVSNASFSFSGGSLTLGKGGVAISNATVSLDNAVLVTYADTAATTIKNDSTLFLNAGSALATNNLTVGTTGSGTITLSAPTLQNSPRIASTTLSIATSTPNSVAQVDVKAGNITNSGIIFVGGTSAGAQGNGALQAIASPGSFAAGTVFTDSLVVYARGSILTNSCGNIMTRVTTIAGNAGFFSTFGSQGGLQASEAVNLLAGSHTSLETSIISPSVTLASGAFFHSAGFLSSITGNLTNAGELRSDGLNIFGLPLKSAYLQSSTGILAGTLGTGPLLNLGASTGILAGTLRLDIPDTLTLFPGESFPIIQASSLFGNFNNIELLGNTPTGLTPTFDPATGLLTLTSDSNGETTGGDSTPISLPEPLSLALLPISLLALSLRLHRRNNTLRQTPNYQLPIPTTPRSRHNRQMR